MIQESRLSKTVFSCSDLSPNNNVDLHKVLTKTCWSQLSSLNVISRHYFILGFSYPIPGRRLMTKITWSDVRYGVTLGEDAMNKWYHTISNRPWHRTVRYCRNRPANIINGCILSQCKITYDDGHVSRSYNTVPNRPNCVSHPMTGPLCPDMLIRIDN